MMGMPVNLRDAVYCHTDEWHIRLRDREDLRECERKLARGIDFAEQNISKSVPKFITSEESLCGRHQSPKIDECFRFINSPERGCLLQKSMA